MSLAVHLQTDDKASPELRKLTRQIHPATIIPLVGRAGTNLVREHLFARDRRANAMGGQRTHYWARAARATNHRHISGGVSININHPGAALHYHGGVVKPVNAKYLAIPASKEAHGRRPREFNNLAAMIRWQKGKRRAVALYDPGKGRAKRVPRSAIRYWLVLRAVIKPDKTVLPSEARLGGHIADVITNYLQRSEERLRTA